MSLSVGQTSKGRTSSGNSVDTTAVTTAATGSNFLVLVVTGHAQGISTPTDNFSNIYSLVRQVVTTNGATGSIYEKINGAGGASHVVTAPITGGPSSVSAFFLEELGAAARDVENGVEDDATPYVSPGVTTINANDILVGGLAGNSGSNPATHTISGASPSGGWTIQTAAEETNGASFWTGGFATQIVSATGTYNSGFTETGAGLDLGAFIVTHKEGATAGNIAWVKA